MLSELEAQGWVVLSNQGQGLDACMLDLAKKLGTPAPGRNNTIIERLKPVDHEQAPPQSLSRQYGFGAFPLHNDTAHWPIPCRYVVLGCEEPGNVESPTVFLDTQRLDLCREETSCINTASFFVKNGRRSFYSSICSKDRPFFRFDPGCMHPVSVDGEKAMRALLSERHVQNFVEISWQKNKVAIIDNWRVLHGRNNKGQADPCRSLLRVMVR